jgi:PST family polysaccharide transporter
MEYWAYSDVISKSGQGLVGIAIVVLGFGVGGLATAGLVIPIVVLVLGLKWIRPLVRIELRTNVRQLTALARASLSYLALGISNFVYTWIDTVVLSLIARDEVVGWYAAPTKVFGALLFIPAITSTAWLPRLVRAFESSEGELMAQARVPVELMLVLSLPICAATALAAQPLIPLLFGNAYRRSVPVMVILAFTAIPMYANVIFGTVLIAMRRQGRLTLLMAVAALVNPALNVFFIQVTEHRYHNGAIGAAICLLLTELLIVLVEVVLISRRFLSPGSLMRLVRAALAALGMWAVGFFARPLGWYVSLPLAGLAFLVLAWLLGVAGPFEKEALQAGLTKVTAKFRGAGRTPANKK